jgi:outer membrane protein assembly factor BamC
MENKMKKGSIVLGLVALTLLAGCAVVDRKQVDYQAGAVQAPSLEVPPDMTLPVADPRYAIPSDDGTQVAKYSDFSRDKSAVKPQVVAASAPVVATTPVAVSAARLLEVAGVRFILLNEPFDRSWRKAGLALERAGIAVGDVDRSKGIYFLKAGGKDKKADDIQVLVHEANGTTDVTVKEGADLHSKEATRILDALFKNLEK